MRISRRLFIRDGVATVTLGLTAPSFLTAIAQAQGLSSSRRLVVVYLGGGNDALNTLVSYQDPSYYNRRPSIAIPAGQVLQVGTDAAGRATGPRPPPPAPRKQRASGPPQTKIPLRVPAASDGPLIRGPGRSMRLRRGTPLATRREH